VRAAFGILGLLVVLAIVGISLRNNLRAAKAVMPVPAASSASSEPFGGASSPSVAQFQQELDRQMKAASERAASAGGEADTVK
jgi:hypothetical protein